MPLAFAAAAAVLAAYGAWTFVPRAPEPLRVELAVLANERSLTDQAARLGLDLPPPEGYGLRGEDDEPAPAAEYADAANAIVEDRLTEALPAPDSDAIAGYFSVAVRVEEEASVVIVLVHDTADLEGRWAQVVFPTDRVWTSSSGRLPAGVHVLPRATFDAGADALYDPGFLVPLGVGGITALVATRREPLDLPVADRIRGFDAHADPVSSESVEAELRELGFAVARLRVRESD